MPAQLPIPHSYSSRSLTVTDPLQLLIYPDSCLSIYPFLALFRNPDFRMET